MPTSFDTSKHGLRMILKDYQEAALRYLWDLGDEGSGSRDVWEHVNKSLKDENTISRASIIKFLNTMADEGVLDYTETTGKGGYRRIYTRRYNEAEFKEKFIRTLIEKLMSSHPNASKKVLTELQDPT